MTQRKSKKETGSEVVEQFLSVVKGGHRVAAISGALLGGFVPLASYGAYHLEVNFDKPIYTQPAMWVVAACLGFSFPKVYSWSKLAFNSTLAGVCFPVITEAAMITFKSQWLSLSALCILVVINAIAAGASLALKPQPKPTWMS